MIAYIMLNSHSTDLITQQNPQYTQNEYVNADDFNNNKQVPEFTNVTNPIMNDTNFYYSDNNGTGQESNTTSFPVMSPHGVPSPMNQTWNSSNRNRSFQ